MKIENIRGEQKMADESSPLDEDNEIFSDIRYICNSTNLITESLQKGFDVTQMPNGDVIVTEIKTINIQYSWDKAKRKMVRIGQNY